MRMDQGATGSGTRNGSGGLPPESDWDIRHLGKVLGRRWWMLVVASVAALGIAWTVNVLNVSTYTATALLEKETSYSPLLAGAGIPTAPTGDGVASAIEVLRSRSVLRPVVDSLGLRLFISYRGPRSHLFQDVEVEPAAPLGRFVLRRGAEGYELVDRASDAVVDRSPAGGWLSAEGVRMHLADNPILEDEVALRIVYGERAVEWLRERKLDLEQPRGTSLIRLLYTDPDPELAAAVVGGVGRVFQEHSARVSREDAGRRRAFLEGQLAELRDSLRTAQDAHLDYMASSGTVAPDVEGQTMIAGVFEAERWLRDLRQKELTLAGLKRAFETSGPSDALLQRIVALGGDVVPGAGMLYERLRELQTERSRLTADPYTGVTAQGPGVAAVDSLIAATRTEMYQIAEQALEVTRSQREAAEERVRELRSEMRELPGRSTAYERLRQQSLAIQTTYNLVAEKLYEAQIAEAVGSSEVEIVDPPVVPVRPDPSHEWRNLGLALVLGLLLGFGCALTVDYFDQRIRGSDEAEEAAGVPVLSSIPLLPSVNGRGRPRLVVGERSVMGEAFRGLYTMIRFSGPKWPRVIAVTSPEPAAGKSTVAANLALVAASNHPRVLLLDADFPRPVQQQVFDLTLRPGLSEVLVGQKELEEVVHRDEEHRLDIITAGSPVPNSADLLASEGFRTLIARLREQYDVVIVDTPPTLALADTPALADAMEAILIVARVHSTNRDALRLATQQIRRVGGKPLGLVLNGTQESAIYGYGYAEAESAQDTRPFNRVRRIFTKG